MPHYITQVDARDVALKSLVDDGYLTLVDQDVEALALDHEVAAADIEREPLDHRIKEYAKCRLYIRICLDHMAVNPQLAQTGVITDIYGVKLKNYQMEEQALKARITKEIFTGEADTTSERTGAIELIRE